MKGSLLRIQAVAWSTLMEALRQKVLWVLALFAVIMIASSIYFADFTFEREFKFIKDVGSASISVLGLLTAMIGAAQLIPTEIERRTIYTTMSKPVFRFEFLLGKYFGLLSLITLMVLGMSVIFFGVVLVHEQIYVAEITAGAAAADWSPEQVRMVEDILEQSRDFGMVQAILLLWARLALVESIALLLSTVATSSIFIIFASVVIYIIGHLQSVAREAWAEVMTENWMLGAFSAVIAWLVPNFQSFSIIDEILAGETISWAYVSQIFSYSVFYTLIVLLASGLIFEEREL